MAPHPNHAWVLVWGGVPEEDLVVTLHPLECPDRVATVKVHAGAEIFTLTRGS